MAMAGVAVEAQENVMSCGSVPSHSVPMHTVPMHTVPCRTHLPARQLGNMTCASTCGFFCTAVVQKVNPTFLPATVRQTEHIRYSSYNTLLLSGCHQPSNSMPVVWPQQPPTHNNSSHHSALSLQTCTAAAPSNLVCNTSVHAGDVASQADQHSTQQDSYQTRTVLSG